MWSLFINWGGVWMHPMLWYDMICLWSDMICGWVLKCHTHLLSTLDAPESRLVYHYDMRLSTEVPYTPSSDFRCTGVATRVSLWFVIQYDFSTWECTWFDILIWCRILSINIPNFFPSALYLFDYSGVEVLLWWGIYFYDLFAFSLFINIVLLLFVIYIRALSN